MRGGGVSVGGTMSQPVLGSAFWRMPAFDMDSVKRVVPPPSDWHMEAVFSRGFLLSTFWRAPAVRRSPVP
eukprot:11172341-Lingulodinium_polyedra.AAC.1